jgi:hypothetical protein
MLRLGAKSLSRAKDYFGTFFRKLLATLGNAQAITATAHKSLASYTTSYTAKSPIPKASSIAAMNKHNNEAK